MRNRNKLVNKLVITLTLVFAAGAAFAFAAGILDVAGTVNIAVSDYVVWTYVEAGPDFNLINSRRGELGATHTAEIVDVRGRTNQRIEWTVNFSEPGEWAHADITATATNVSAIHSAIITNVTYGWNDDNGVVDDFGLLVYIIPNTFLGVTLAPEASASVLISASWDGIIPPEAEAADFTNTFFIEFDYELAP